MPAANPPEVLRVRDVAQALSMSPASVRRPIADGTISSVRIGKAVRVPQRDLRRLLGEGDPK